MRQLTRMHLCSVDSGGVQEDEKQACLVWVVRVPSGLVDAIEKSDWGSRLVIAVNQQLLVMLVAPGIVEASVHCTTREFDRAVPDLILSIPRLLDDLVHSLRCCLGRRARLTDDLFDYYLMRMYRFLHQRGKAWSGSMRATAIDEDLRMRREPLWVALQGAITRAGSDGEVEILGGL